MVFDSNLGDLKDVIDVFNIPFHIGPISLIGCGNTFSGQNPGQCSHHSGRNGADHMVQRGGMFFLWFKLIKILDSAMNPVMDLAWETLDDRPSRGA
jgi:hypothetical protein